MKEKSVNISFRIQNPEVAAELLRQWQESGEKSPSLYARRLLTEALTRSDAGRHQLDTIKNQLAETRQELHELRRDLRSSVNLLLAKAGKLTLDQARSWCEKTLVRE